VNCSLDILFVANFSSLNAAISQKIMTHYFGEMHKWWDHYVHPQIEALKQIHNIACSGDDAELVEASCDDDLSLCADFHDHTFTYCISDM
jgi:hypothetical protein